MVDVIGKAKNDDRPSLLSSETKRASPRKIKNPALAGF